MLMEVQAVRKRSDHRSEPAGGSLGRYLLGAYLLPEASRPNWHPRAVMKAPPDQMYETRRTSSGHFVHVEGGRPAMKARFLNHLSGVPWQAVAAAVEIARIKDPDAVWALELYQRPRFNRYQEAESRGYHEASLSKLYERAVRRVHDHVWEAMRAFDDTDPGAS